MLYTLLLIHSSICLILIYADSTLIALIIIIMIIYSSIMHSIGSSIAIYSMIISYSSISIALIINLILYLIHQSIDFAIFTSINLHIIADILNLISISIIDMLFSTTHINILSHLIILFESNSFYNYSLAVGNPLMQLLMFIFIMIIQLFQLSGILLPYLIDLINLSSYMMANYIFVIFFIIIKYFFISVSFYAANV